jgi:hypothetical protein
MVGRGVRSLVPYFGTELSLWPVVDHVVHLFPRSASFSVTHASVAILAHCLLIAPGAMGQINAAQPPAEQRATGPNLVVLWPRDTLRLPPAGASLGVGVARWRVADSTVASISDDGLLEAIKPGATRLTAEASGARTHITVRVMPAVRGRVFAADSSVLGTLGVELRSGGDTIRTTVDATGAFLLRLSEFPDSVRLLIDAPKSARRGYLPSLVRVSRGALDSELRIVLVPTVWTIRQGIYRGQLQPVSLEAAFRSDGEASGFYRAQRDRARRRTKLVAWPIDSFPLAVAIRSPGVSEGLSAGDSVALWNLLGRLEMELGQHLFRPASEGDIPVQANGILVSVNRSLPTAGYTFTAYGDQGRLYDVRVTVRSRDMLGDSRIMEHEMLHALGFGHTRSWISLLNPGDGQRATSPTVADIAYAQLFYRVLALQERLDAPYGLLEALAGELEGSPAVEGRP